MALSPGARLGAYEILSPLGSGGMGEVYRARHLRLGREVAIKVLPSDLASDPERRQRFEREARTASSLNHPNIVTIHDVDEQDGIHFIAMELVEGDTLRERLREGPLPSAETLAFGTQIAAGLARAHATGIVHRDLKPENVMITRDGRVKILDFGLAKLAPPSEEGISELTTADQATRAGLVLGTVPYMSPEQAAGRPADARSDQFSFGSILYEMATGQRAFRKPTPPQTLAAIIEANPEPMGRLNDRVPVALVRIVERCLAKRPAERFESTDDLLADLEKVAVAGSSVRTRRRALTLAAVLALATAGAVVGLTRARWLGWLSPEGATVRITSLAVLPLHNVSEDPGQEYLADGMTEALITDLAKIEALKVIGRSSAMRYKGTDKPVADIAAELGVDALVEGSAVRVGNAVQVMAQLVDPRTEQALWAESYERDFEDVLRLQREVARAIAREVAVNLTPTDERRLGTAPAVDREVYDAYLQGQFHFLKLTPPDLDAALSYFERALEKDPTYAPAWAGIALVWGGRLQMGYVPAFEATPHVEAAVRRALELDDSLAEVHGARAALEAWGKWDWAAADEAFQRALELNPNDAEIRASYSHFLHIVRRPEEAMRQIEKALELDPQNAFYRAFYGVDLMFVRRFDDAIEAAREALQTSPRLPVALLNLSEALHLKGRYQDALEAERAYRVAMGDREGEGILQIDYSEEGYRDAMHRLADREAERSLRTRTNAFEIAGQYVRAGDDERALRWLERAYDDRDPNLPYLGLPVFDSLRDDPRFDDLLRRMRLTMWIEEG